MNTLFLILVAVGTSTGADDLGLPPLSFDFQVPLDRISIIADRKAALGASAGTVTVDQEMLDRFEYDDIHQVLTTVPGVYVRGEDGYGLRPNIGLRGVNPDRSAKVTLLEDGVLLGPAPYSAPAAYYFPITTRMIGLEVHKGPSLLAFGPNTIAGAVDLLTRPIPDAMEANLDAAIGMNRFGKFHGNWGMRGKYWGVVLEGIHLRTDGFKALDNDGPTGFAKNEAMLKVQGNTDLSDPVSHIFEAKLGYADERSHETYLGLSESDFANTPYRRYAASQDALMTWRRTQAVLTYTLNADDWKNELVGYRHDFNRVWTKLNRFRDRAVRPLFDILNAELSEDEGQRDVLRGDVDTLGRTEVLLSGSNDRKFVSQGLANRLTWSPTIGAVEQRITLGLRIHQDQIVRNHTELPYRLTNGVPVPDALEPTPEKQNVGAALAFSGYLFDEIRWAGLTAKPIVRFEYIQTEFTDRTKPEGDPGRVSTRTQTAVLPGLHLGYEFIDGLAAHLGAHRGFSPTTPGQPDTVAPEQSWSYEAGLHLAYQETDAKAVGFFNDYSNITGECTDSSGCGADLNGDQFNGGAARIYGLELSVRQEFEVLGKLTLFGALDYTLTLSEFRTAFDARLPAFESVEIGDRMAYVPIHQGSLAIGASGAEWSAAVLVRHVGQMRDIPGQGPIAAQERIIDHTVVDLSASWSPFAGNEVYLKIENLFDLAYPVSRRPYGLRPGRPFHLMVGYKYRFGS